MVSDFKNTKKILVVDDEAVIRDVMEDYLSSEGYEVISVDNGHEALLELEEERYDALISDLMMPEMSGLELIEQINQKEFQLVTIIMTGYGTIETAVKAMKIGAYDYILKPFKMEEVLQVLKRSFEIKALKEENINLRETVNLFKVSEAIANSTDIKTILTTIVNALHEEKGADYIYLYLPNLSLVPDFEFERYSDKVKPYREKINLDVKKIEKILLKKNSILAPGRRSSEYLQVNTDKLKAVSLYAIPIKINNLNLGFLSMISFSNRVTFTEGYRRFLSILATKTAATIENLRLIGELKEANRELTEANQTIKENLRQTILGFARAIEQNDPYTRGHSDRVAKYAKQIAIHMKFDNDFIEEIEFAGQLHDIGKIGISHQKLNKAGKLNAPEIKMFRKHPEMGKKILEPIPFMRHLIPGVYCHHEKYDGTGYPQGLAEEGIPLMGRIIAVADTFDAMTSDRSYRKALSAEVAVEELKRNSGTQFDPEIVKAFLEVLDGKKENI
ncbi:MAG: HD domain-containing phosphohydrolase [Myxococcota bacterium]